MRSDLDILGNREAVFLRQGRDGALMARRLRHQERDIFGSFARKEVLFDIAQYPAQHRFVRRGFDVGKVARGCFFFEGLVDLFARAPSFPREEDGALRDGLGQGIPKILFKGRPRLHSEQPEVGVGGE